jgi:NADPH-dependent curcumin reductase CurA
MAEPTQTSIVLRKRPVGEPRVDDFEVVHRPIVQPGPDQVLVRTIFLSIDPYMRGRLSEAKSYAEPIAIGGVMGGEGLGEVIASRSPHLAVGDVVQGTRLWQSHVVAEPKQLVKLDRHGPPLASYLGVLGMPGTTAYSGMTDIGQPKAGETVLISAASGAVGSVAGQLAKRAGARVVGIAGGADKCLFVQETLGFDACIDHRVVDLKAALDDACPNGIDVYFENVGGDLQRLVFARLNPFARVIMCGMVAEYNDTSPRPGPNLMFVVRNRVRIEGLIVSDKMQRFAEWRALATPWVIDGSLKYREDIVEGLENAPGALIGLLSGRNFGKLLVRVGPDPA